MRKTTDINGLKDVAKMMLHLPMTETEFDFIINFKPGNPTPLGMGRRALFFTKK